MLTADIQAALRRARCEWLPEDKTYYCEIADLPGVWATGQAEVEARAELQDALEGWIALGLALRQPFPVLDGIEIHVARRLMPPFGPVSRDQLIAYLRRLGFDRPFAGGSSRYSATDGNPASAASISVCGCS